MFKIPAGIRCEGLGIEAQFRSQPFKTDLLQTGKRILRKRPGAALPPGCMTAGPCANSKRVRNHTVEIKDNQNIPQGKAACRAESSPQV